MSKSLNLGLVGEGKTDRIVLEAILTSIFSEKSFVLDLIRPEYDEFSNQFGPAGWGGVYQWCKQTRQRSPGGLKDDVIFANHDALIIQIDADVAGFTYGDATIEKSPGDGQLPCALPCPPPKATADALRDVVLTWLPIVEVGAPVVFCIPSKCSEAWVIAMLYPNDKFAKSNAIECYPNPELRFSAQPKPKIGKSSTDYQAKAQLMITRWPTISNINYVSQAAIFEAEIRRVIGPLFQQPT